MRAIFLHVKLELRVAAGRKSGTMDRVHCVMVAWEKRDKDGGLPPATL